MSYARATWRAIVVALLISVTLGATAWGTPPAREEDLPNLSQLAIFQPGEPSLLYDDEERVFGSIVPEYRIFVPLSRIPLKLRQAIIAAEDARFYEHGALDLQGIARAAVRNLMSASVKEGGSTITQQLAKTLFLSHERTIGRKVKELQLAGELEQRYTKDQILEMYLNAIYFGHGAYGVEAAARIYFSKSVTGLTLSEAALLAGLVRAPGRYSPLIDVKRAKARRQYVLNRMVATGALKQPQARRANLTPVSVNPMFRSKGMAPWFIDYVRAQLDERLGQTLVRQGGLKIYTTLNAGMQRAAVKAISRGIGAIAQRRKEQTAGATATPEGALIALDARSGEIKALVGGSDYSHSQFNRAVQARRQPGSAFKPFVYAAAFERGLTAATISDDAPISFEIGAGRRSDTWAPENVDRKYRGPVTLRQALEESINVPTVRLIAAIGVDPVIDLARRLGITSELRREYAMALGVSEVSLLELTSAYQAFANRGTLAPPFAIRRVVGPGEIVIEEQFPQPQQVMSEEVAFVLTSVLEGAVERGTGKAARRIGRPVAAKTGTTQAAEDLWFIGYTPSVVAGVWLGYDQRRSIGSHETAGKVAAPIWVDFVKQSLGDSPVEPFLPPEGVVRVLINRKTGQPTSSADPDAFEEYVIRGQEDLPPPALALPTANGSSLRPSDNAVLPPLPGQ
ncbi:MAG: penicillin-binding protein 1A [Candidatus Methylomirabilis oxygeniifera]|uniref:Multimodular transpeptidase-transglycosylase n=1 Tax=Methylomirabilis oxygeniifera TaxID=671143 RepID=D5MKR4_METO1|nr:MAG: penicillin-binding protein 1A [Candidatus Methylomirabilis oxyfera]CBE67711.1 Multimodular transpeptidase-transglycosylase [Candidatus Methylomirabilis oxyfera]